jgi:hypothetical protein
LLPRGIGVASQCHSTSNSPSYSTASPYRKQLIITN